MNEQDLINEAIERYLESHHSKEGRQRMMDEYGKQIASKVETIYDEAIHCPVDWRTATMDDALDTMHELLHHKYPC